MQKAYLTLADGCVYSGFAFGYPGEAVGELVFTTSMSYLETLTDPCYYGQIVVEAFPLVGNYGVIPADLDAPAPTLSAFIVRDLATVPSNFRCEGTLDDYLRENKIPGIYGIDTRSLIRHIRDRGTMNAKITVAPPQPEDILPELKEFSLKNAVLSVSRSERETLALDGAKYRVALWDMGVNRSILSGLSDAGCEITVFPADSKHEDMLRGFDGIVISGGPGAPEDNEAVIGAIADFLDKKIPLLGIGLGHQLIALAAGGKTEKLPYGHRGVNQPVCRVADGRVFSTSQNHGYSVVAASLAGKANETFRNINDGSCEGLEYISSPAISIQFTPDCGQSPQNTGYIYEDFAKMMEGGKTNA